MVVVQDKRFVWFEMTKVIRNNYYNDNYAASHKCTNSKVYYSSSLSYKLPYVRLCTCTVKESSRSYMAAIIVVLLLTPSSLHAVSTYQAYTRSTIHAFCVLQ